MKGSAANAHEYVSSLDGKKDDRASILDSGIISGWTSFTVRWMCTRTCRQKLGLLSRRQNDWKAVEELTESLRKMDSCDPVKYDYGLFGMGMYENL